MVFESIKLTIFITLFILIIKIKFIKSCNWLQIFNIKKHVSIYANTYSLRELDIKTNHIKFLKAEIFEFKDSKSLF